MLIGLAMSLVGWSMAIASPGPFTIACATLTTILWIIAAWIETRR